MVVLVSGLTALLTLLLVLKLSQRLTLRLRVLAGVSVSRSNQKSCPHLGLAADPFTHGERPSDDHRCYLWMQRDRIDLVHQKGFCLTAAHHKCPWLMVRRPDAVPPLRQRLPRLAGELPRRAWAMASMAVRSIASLGHVFRKPGQAAAAQPTIHVALSSLSATLPAGQSAAPSEAAPDSRPEVAASPRPARQSPSAASQPQVPERAFQAGVTVRRAWAAVSPMARILGLAMATLADRAGTALSRHGGRFAAATVRFVRTYGPPAARMTGRAIVAGARYAGVAIAWLSVRLWWLAKATFRLLAAAVRAAVAAQQRRREAKALAVAPIATVQHDALLEEQEAVAQPVFVASVQVLDDLIAEGLATLDRGQESLAYQLFVKATEQRPAARLDAAARAQFQGLLTRAWFWRAKTAETVQDVVASLEAALTLEPGNLQMQAHLAWARQRLEREQKLQASASVAEQAPALIAYQPPTPPKPGLKDGLGEAIRVLGGMAALALAVLWLTAGLVPALGKALTTLPAADQILIGRLLLTVNSNALPAHGHLDLPMFNYDLGLSLPFVLAFLFVFTARGLVDGDRWARRGGLLLAAIGGWLCFVAVTNPEAARLGLLLCIGILIAVVIGRFDSPKVLPGMQGAYM